MSLPKEDAKSKEKLCSGQIKGVLTEVFRVGLRTSVRRRWMADDRYPRKHRREGQHVIRGLSSGCEADRHVDDGPIVEGIRAKQCFGRSRLLQKEIVQEDD